jgi:hypothetical protein
VSAVEVEQVVDHSNKVSSMMMTKLNYVSSAVSAVEVEPAVDHSKKVSSMMMTKLEITAPSPKRSCANLSPKTY